MDNLEERLQRYRPASPSPELRARVVRAARQRNAWSFVGAWLPAAAAVMATLLFYWLSAAERDRIVARFVPVPPIDQSVTLINEEPEQ
jgi:hypothetical protein